MSWDPVFRFVKQIPRGRVLTYGRWRKPAPPRRRAQRRTRYGSHSLRKRYSLASRHRERGKILIREPYASLQRKLSKAKASKSLISRGPEAPPLETPKKSALEHSASKKRIQKVKPQGVCPHVQAGCYLRYAIPSCPLRLCLAVDEHGQFHLPDRKPREAYGDVEAVRGSASMWKEGEVSACLGPNGAGKTPPSRFSKACAI